MIDYHGTHVEMAITAEDHYRISLGGLLIRLQLSPGLYQIAES